MALRFDGRVAIVTGAGNGLGKEYALLLASRGAKVVVNDLGGGRAGEGSSSRPADDVVHAIRSAGGAAVADYHSVEDGAAIVQTALDNYGRIDIVVNNAGILRDKSLARMTDQDWDLVQAVHLRGSFQVTRAAFPHFKKQGYGRVIMTSSVAGIYGNFGQANYSAAKLGVHGLSQTVAREGARYSTHCNTVAPMGGTRLTQDILPQDLYSGLKPELIAPLVAYLCHEDCEENGGLFEAAGGWFGKYRFERSQGAVCRGSLSELVTPETVKERWGDITSFRGALHPQSNEEAAGLLAGVLQNLYEKDHQKMLQQQQRRSYSSAAPPPPPAVAAAGAAGAKGPGAVVGYKQDPVPYVYTSRDAVLYALGVGVSTRDPDHLQFLYEGSTDFSLLPTFAIMASQDSVMGGNLMSGGCQGYAPYLPKIVHAEQFLEIYKPLSPHGGTLYSTLEVQDVLDKRNGALMVLKVDITNEEAEAVASTQWLLYVVGDGKFGGPRNNKCVVPLATIPDRKPDATVTYITSVDQAALYRMSGDLNPLHIDPSFAAIGGFKQPLLHGLCSLGVACRAVVSTYCGGEPDRIKAIKVRFAKPVLPGQTLITEMWQEGSRVLFRCLVGETMEVCLNGGYVEMHESSSPPQQEAEAPSVSSLITSERSLGVYQRLEARVAEEGALLVKKVRGVFQFNITSGGKKTVAQWTVDLHAAPGTIYPGPPRGIGADVTLTMDEEYLLQLETGELNPQKAFMGSLVQVDGNVALSQRLSDLFGTTNKSKL